MLGGFLLCLCLCLLCGDRVAASMMHPSAVFIPIILFAFERYAGAILCIEHKIIFISTLIKLNLIDINALFEFQINIRHSGSGHLFQRQFPCFFHAENRPVLLCAAGRCPSSALCGCAGQRNDDWRANFDFTLQDQSAFRVDIITAAALGGLECNLINLKPILLDQLSFGHFSTIHLSA